MRRLLLLVRSLLLLFLASSPASADLTSPCISPAWSSIPAFLLSPRSNLGPLVSIPTPLPAPSQPEDYHTAIVALPNMNQQNADPPPLTFLVSRAAEIVYTVAKWSMYAIRYYNNSVELGAGGDDEFNVYSKRMLPGTYTAMTNGKMHICLLSTTMHILCLADSPALDNSTGVLFGHRANVTFSEVSASDFLTCGLRLEDARVECYGVSLDSSLGQTLIAFNTSGQTYRAIAAQSDGYCGLTTDTGDMLCTSIVGAAEALYFPAPTLPLFFRSPLASCTFDSKCVTLSDGTIQCLSLPAGASVPQVPEPTDQTQRLDQVAASGSDIACCYARA